MQSTLHAVQERARPLRSMQSKTAGADGDILPDLIKGALAGAVGTLALDAVTWFMWDREDREALEQERQARPEGLDPAHYVASKAARAAGIELTPKQPHPAGLATHFAIGVMPAALYGVLSKRVPQVRTGRGLLYGLALFLVQDEVVNSVAGFSGRPMQYPWQAHVRGLVGHLAYGAATDATLELLNREG